VHGETIRLAMAVLVTEGDRRREKKARRGGQRRKPEKEARRKRELEHVLRG
jgi:hypothetical protein